MAEQNSTFARTSSTLHHWLFLLALYIAAIPSVLAPSPGLILVFNVGLGWWAIHDSIVRGHPIPFFSRSWFIVFPGLLVPLYVIWSRGWRGAALLIGHLMAWYAVCFVIMTVMLIAQVVWSGIREISNQSHGRRN